MQNGIYIKIKKGGKYVTIFPYSKMSSCLTLTENIMVMEMVNLNLMINHCIRKTILSTDGLLAFITLSRCMNSWYVIWNGYTSNLFDNYTLMLSWFNFWREHWTYYIFTH